MQRPVKLFRKMGRWVGQYVKHYASDLDIDMDVILGAYPESLSPSGSYYWYLRECGTQLMSIEDLAWKGTRAYSNAENWLSKAVVIFRVNVKAETLTPVSRYEIETVLGRARDMDDQTKLAYVIRFMENLSGTAELLAYEAVYRAASTYHFTLPWYIAELAGNSRLTYDVAIAQLKEFQTSVPV